MLFADDSQLYLTCERAIDSTPIMEKCIDEIRDWMVDNRLVLNDSKTEIMHIRSKFQERWKYRKPEDLSSLRVGETQVEVSDCVRDLGVYLNNRADMSNHVKKTCQNASYALYKIGRIRNVLDRTDTEKLVHAFVTSRLDYCNSLLFGIEDMHITKLQVLQNSAARLVTRTRLYEHITPVRQALHWLPIPARIEFKILLFVYKILHQQAPAYLSDLISIKVPVRVLRSNPAPGVPELEPADWDLKNYGFRSFSNAAPTLWNVLPHDVRMAPSVTSFKTALKTHLFRQHYGLT